MVSQGLFSIGGIASGLDTENMIQQLMALERQPVKRLERQQADLGLIKDAWAKVTTKLSSLRTAVDKIARADRFDDFMTVSSSNEDAVTVTSTGTTDADSLSFTVDQLATRQQYSSTDAFTGTDDLLNGRELQITIEGVTHDLTAGLAADATLGDLVDAVNAADLGVKATALQVNSGEFRLALDATQTGTDGTFGATGAGWTDPLAEVQAAKDARLQVGGITVTRSSNTIDDLIEGATIHLHSTTTDPVTITSERDIDGAVAAVKGFVDGINGVLTTLKNLTAYDPESREAGPLQGEALARRLADSLRDAVSHAIPGLDGSDALASSLGISLTREGTLQFDEATARQAFTDDFTGTAARLGRAGSTTDEAALFLNATSAATPGTYQVQVTQAAEVASVVGDPYQAPGAGVERILRFERGDGSFTDITLGEAHATAADAVAHIRDSLAAAGVDAFEVTDEGGALKVASVAYGSAARFEITEVDAGGNDTGGDAFGLAVGQVTGVDVAGTIGGEAATGTGRTLQGIAGPAEGVSIRIDGQPAAFDVTWSRGLVGEVGAALSRAEGSGGLVSQARASLDSQVDIYQDRIDSFERRLETREATIRRQFVAMESMLGQLNSQGNWLNQQLAGLSSLNQQS